MHIDARAAEIMRRQHGTISRSQVAETGMSRGQLRRRVASGSWVQVLPKVYRTAGIAHSWEASLIASCLAAGGVASHRSAGWLWGLDGLRKGRPEITVPRGARPEVEFCRVHESTQFGWIDETVQRGIPCTGIARTLLDLGAVVDEVHVLLMIDSAMRKGLVDWPDLYAVLLRHSRRGRSGCGVLRNVLEDRYGAQSIPDSAWNRMVAQLLTDVGLPEPLLEHEVTVGERFIARVDLAYPDLLVAIELDSIEWHLNRTSFAKDARRRNELVNAGWTVLTFTWQDFADEPEKLCASVAHALRRQGRSAA